MKKIFLGELLGTFVLVLIGCSSVAVNVLYGWLNLYSIAAVWALAVALGIYLSKRFCFSHLNPAVTLGFYFRGDYALKNVFPTIAAQFIGAFIAGATVYLIFNSSIVIYEESNGIIRGYELSEKTAMIFGEYYPNPANAGLSDLSTWKAILFEGIGTFALMLGILILIRFKKIPTSLVPILIGSIVGILIIIIAPYTQCGINPARDFSPRLFSFLAGWKGVSFSAPNFGWMTVYMISPLIGGITAGVFSKFLWKK